MAASGCSSVHPQMFASKHKLKQTKERVARLRREGQQDIYTDEELEREGLLTEQLLPRNRTLQPSTLPSGSWLLGACDAEFVKGRPTFVDLLVFCEEPLDPGRLVAALQAALDTGFGCVAGRRHESAVEPTGGLRFSHVRAATIATDSGGAPTLFDSPPRRPAGEPTEVLTVRLTTAPLHCPTQSSLGVVWDHAMCDVGGIALLLAHVSACYAVRPSPPPPRHDRSLQRASVAARPVKTRGSAEPSEPAARCDLATPAPNAALREGGHRRRGVGVVVEWASSGDELQLLKAEAVAHTRHEALFAEALCLLREAGDAELEPRTRTRTLTRTRTRTLTHALTLALTLTRWRAAWTTLARAGGCSGARRRHTPRASPPAHRPVSPRSRSRSTPSSGRTTT